MTSATPVDAEPILGDVSINNLEISLYDWQREALTEWAHHDHSGVVEAVTGAGKTRLGLAAVQLALNEGFEALVIVPTKELLHQWKAELEKHLDVYVGVAGDGRDDWFDTFDVVVATIHTAKNKRDDPALYRRILVADECHRYGAEGWSLALTEDYDWRLGLTATYARPDGRHASVLDEYFGGIIFTLWYDRALRDGLIAQFEVGFVAVRLSHSDEIKYFEIDEKRSSIYRNLRRFLDHDPSPNELMAIVNTWADSPGAESHQRIARGYRSVLQERKRLLAESRAKIDALQLLGEQVLDAQGTLVFTDTQESARQAAQALMEVGSSAIAVYSDLERHERERAISTFRRKEVSTLVAPKILDEGIDVPDADLGILLASNRSRRQLVQRMGRVLRKKSHGGHARILVFYAQGTIEDPKYVGIENLEHFSEILPFARRVEYFDIEHDLLALIEFLGSAGDDNSGLPLTRSVRPSELHEEISAAADVYDNPFADDVAVPDIGWLLRQTLREGILHVGDNLVCRRERTRNFGEVTIESNGSVRVSHISRPLPLARASHRITGVNLTDKVVLNSWETSAGESLWEIWLRLLKNDNTGEAEWGDFGEGGHIGAPTATTDTDTKFPESLTTTLDPEEPNSTRNESLEPEPRRPQSEVELELLSNDESTLLIVRVAGNRSLCLSLDSATAGALGGQLISAAHLPLPASFSVAAQWVPGSAVSDKPVHDSRSAE